MRKGEGKTWKEYSAGSEKGKSGKRADAQINPRSQGNEGLLNLDFDHEILGLSRRDPMKPNLRAWSIGRSHPGLHTVERRIGSHCPRDKYGVGRRHFGGPKTHRDLARQVLGSENHAIVL